METKYWVIIGIVGVIIAAIVLYYLYFTAPSAPVAGSNSVSENSITWSWNASFNASGYKWSITNNFETATDVGAATSAYQSGLTENTQYAIYVWAYNTHGNSPVTILSAMTTSIAAPIAGNSVASVTSITWNWNPVAGAVGYKYSTTGDYTNAIDNSIATTYTQDFLQPSTPNTLFVWAYDNVGASAVTPLTANTTAPICPVGTGWINQNDLWAQSVYCAKIQIMASNRTQGVKAAAVAYLNAAYVANTAWQATQVNAANIGKTSVQQQIVLDAFAHTGGL